MKKQIIGYIRVSTDDQASKGNGLEAQRLEIVKFAAENDYEVLEIVREDASGKLGLEDRPVLRAALSKSLKLKAALVVSKLDRLSRSAAFILNLMESRAKFIVTQFGEDVDAFMLHIYASVGQKERTMISERTSAALQVMKSKGVKLGNPSVADYTGTDGEFKLGMDSARELAAKAVSDRADAFAENLRPSITRMMNAGMSFRAIASEFNDTGVKTARGGAWSASTVKNIIARLI